MKYYSEITILENTNVGLFVCSVCVHAHAYMLTVSLPKLVDFDWRVDVKTSSDAVARMSVPTCILNLQVSC